MTFLTTLLGIIGFEIGIPFGIFFGYFLLVFSKPCDDAKDPIIRHVRDLDTSYVVDALLPDIPEWTKHPDYDRIDWMNKVISDIWPYADKAICNIIRKTTESITSEYIGKFTLKSVDFKNLTLGTLSPIINGIKVLEGYETGLLFEPAVKWAGNSDITLVLKLLWLPITIQLVDIHVFATPRITLRPLLPTFPCFGNIVVSLLEKPHVDFGMKFMGLDLMAIPGLYTYVQETIIKQVTSLYMWPHTLEIPILDDSIGATKRPIGILYVKVLRAHKLLKMDIIGTSDPYVKISLSGDGLPSKKPSIKMNNLNPEWNEEFRLAVKDPESQVLQLHLFDYEKIGNHDKLGMQEVPLRMLTPHETKQCTLNLVKNKNPNDGQDKKFRGELVLELKYNPFKDDSSDNYFSSDHNNNNLESYNGEKSLGYYEDVSSHGSGMLMVTIQSADDVEGKHHNNPYAVITCKGECKKTEMMKKTRNPCWNEEFQFLLEETPLKEKLHIEVKSKRKKKRLKKLGFRPEESLGYVAINLEDVVHNGHINKRYNLIKSREGVIHVDIKWKVI